MNNKTGYKLANIQKKEMKLRKQRRDILAVDSQKALDMILDAPAPVTLVQSFPDQDLYYLMHKIGPFDFIPVLSMARSDQWEYILDVEVWDNDRLDIDGMTKIFDLLFQADPERLLRWIVKEKPDFFEFYLFKNMVIKIREHDEPPPEDSDDYITIDDKFYFRFPDKPESIDSDSPGPGRDQESWELIEKMLKTVAGMDLSVFHGLLLETKGTLPSEVEEEQFRLKNLRLAEKGFLPAHEAIGIYQPTRFASLGKRPKNDILSPAHFDPDIPWPPQFFSEFIKGDDLFVCALKLFNSQAVLHLESELAALINKVISADKIKLRSKEDLDKAVEKTCAYLNLGLEVILEKRTNPEQAQNIIQTYFLEDIFRTGSRAGIKLKTMAVNWYKNSFINTNLIALSFLGEKFLGIIGGLLLDRPMVYDPEAKGMLYRNFNSLSDIFRTEHALNKIIALDMVSGRLMVDLTTFEQGILTYKSLILTLWAKNRLNLPSTLEPIETDIFKKFFSALFPLSCKDRTKQIPLSDLTLWIMEATGMDESALPESFNEVLKELINELEEEYGSVSMEDIDPRFIPHFLLKKTHE